MSLIYSDLVASCSGEGGGYCPQLHEPLQGGHVNDCSCLNLIDKRFKGDQDARGATQLQRNHDSFELACHP
jgi:hypothetical protein